MEPDERLKTYQGFAETSRKWVSVYDAKAGFVSAMNAALLGFIWTGAKFGAEAGSVRYLAAAATILSVASLSLALLLVLPRISLRAIFGKGTCYQNEYEPISFFSHVACNYSPAKWEHYRQKVDAMGEQEFTLEALEQHFTICHSLQKKSGLLSKAGATLILAMVLTASALLLRGFA